MALRKTVIRARKLRRNMTPPEVKLWAVLRKEPDGLRFRRQHPAGPFVLDFYCAAARLGIEIDGVAHDMGANPQRDDARDTWLAKAGIPVLRVLSSDVMSDLDAVVRLILNRCAFPLHRPADGPPPHAARGEDE